MPLRQIIEFYLIEIKSMPSLVGNDEIFLNNKNKYLIYVY